MKEIVKVVITAGETMNDLENQYKQGNIGLLRLLVEKDKQIKTILKYKNLL